MPLALLIGLAWIALAILIFALCRAAAAGDERPPRRWAGTHEHPLAA